MTEGVGVYVKWLCDHMPGNLHCMHGCYTAAIYGKCMIISGHIYTYTLKLILQQAVRSVMSTLLW